MSVLLERFPRQQFAEHPEWVNEDAFAADIEDEIQVFYQPIRDAYKWEGISLKAMEAGRWRGFYFDPASGRQFDIGEHIVAEGEWVSPNVPSPQDWVLVMKKVEAIKE